MSSRIQRKISIYGISVSLWCLLMLFAGRTEAFAAVKEGKPGETVSGEYVVIVNTNTVSPESTGTLVFDNSGNSTPSEQTASAAEGMGEAALAEQENDGIRAAAVSSYDIGDTKTIGSGGTYVCIGEGAHCYIWMSQALKPGYDAAGKTEVIARDMAATYDGVPWRTLNALAGGNIPCMDNTGKLSILLETLTGASGVYKGESGITAIHINTPEADSYQPGAMESRNGLLVHEGQHALFRLRTEFDYNQPYLWLNEGLAVAAMDYIWGGTDSNGWMDGIVGNADIRNGSSLFYKDYRNSTARDYGMPYLFVRYLIARKTGGYNPMELFPLFYRQNANCIPETYIEKVLGDGTKFSDLLTEFYTAVIAQEPDGEYGFAGDGVVCEKVRNYPLYMGGSDEAHMLPATGAIVLRVQNGTFTVPSDGGRSIRYMIIGEGRKIPAPAAGDGTSQNPYRITSFRELNLIGSQPDACYRLDADIESGGKLNLTVNNFRGVLDGNGHVIRGLKQPLTGRNSGTIRNLTIEADFDGEYANAQGIFARENDRMITDCTAKGKVSVRLLRGQSTYAEAAFGGIVGINNQSGTIRGCGFAATVSVQLPAVKSRVGGVAGIQQGYVEKCYSRGSLTVTQPGGIEHETYVSGFGDSYDVYVGGLAGELRKQTNMGGSMSYCVHTGSISVQGGNQAVGQLCGLVNDNIIKTDPGLSGHLERCYARQNGIPAIGYPGGVIAEEGILLTDEAAKNPSSYQGWDFSGEWKIDGDGPVRVGADDVREIEASGYPTGCYVGEHIFNWGKLLVNGGSGIKIQDDMISGFDSTKPGRISVTVSYMGKTTSFFMEIREPEKVSNLKVSSNAKNVYNVGDFFNPDSLYLLATIDDKPGKMIYSGFDYDRKAPLTVADTSVRLSYYGASVEYPITVKGKTAAGIAMISKMGRTSYQEGQRLDLSGVCAQLTYSNGEKTAILGPEQFDAYGIRVARCLGSSVTTIQKDTVLQVSDKGASIYLCVGDTLPGTYGAIAASAGTLTVYKKLKISGTEIPLLSGREEWLMAGPVTGGSGQYRIQVVEEHLPAGISRTGVPQSENGYFSYRGKTTAPDGSVFTSTYCVEDTMTGITVNVKVTMHVNGLKDAAFYQFDLLKNFNPGLKDDVIGIIRESVIVLKVPAGTDVSNLAPTIDFGYSTGVSLPKEFWNGTKHDFTKPVVYTLTAPDGVTQKSYTVSVEFVPVSGTGTDQPDENGSEDADKNGNENVEPTQPGGTPSAGGGNTGGSGGTSASGDGTGSAVGTGTGSTSQSGGTPATGGGSVSSGSPQKVYPPVGKVIKSGAASYRITASSAKTKTVEVKGLVKAKTASLKIPASVKIDGYTYRVTGISKKAFQNNKYLKKITIGKYVTTIGANACKGCKKLTAVILPPGIQKIGDGAFYGCTGLKTVTAGKSLQKIGKSAFQNCRNLRTLTLQGQKLRSVGKNAIKGVYKKVVIRVPKKSVKAYQKLFQKKTGYVKTMKIVKG